MVVEGKANTVVDPLLPLQCYWLKFGLGVLKFQAPTASASALLEIETNEDFFVLGKTSQRQRPLRIYRRRRHKISELLLHSSRAAKSSPNRVYRSSQPGAAMTTTSKNEGDQAAAASVKKKAELMEWVEKRKAEGAKLMQTKAAAAKPFSDGCADL